MRLLHILLGATTHVLQFGDAAQRLVLGRGKLLFERGDAGGEILVLDVALGGFVLGGLGVLFVGHGVLL